jgi:acyl-homoserine lactone acylase PvdQ
MTGVPVVVGKTNYSCLAFTTVYTDTQDLYHEKIEGNEYIVDNHRMKLKQRK